ncbi:hypothetical protein GPALN_002232 [Globodera pallida]|nr:hypothetical protein GPALN_002232 [Globodera pallida]
MDTDSARPAWETASLLESQVDRIGKEVHIVEVYLDEMREASSAWTKFISSLSSKEREEEEIDYIAFDKHERIAERYEEATTNLRDLRDLETRLSINAKLFKSKVDREAKAEQAAHAQLNYGSFTANGTGTIILRDLLPIPANTAGEVWRPQEEMTGILRELHIGNRQTSVNRQSGEVQPFAQHA